MTQVIVAIAAIAAIVAVLCIVMVLRSRRDDEGERFRQVADLTSGWSRENHAAHEPASGHEPGAAHEPAAAHVTIPEPVHEPVVEPVVELERPRAKRSRATESVDTH